MIDDRQLDGALDSFHRDPATHPGLEVVVQRVLASPIEKTPRRQGLLPQLPAWRFDPMLSATKFLVTGAILALVGGFLLSGVLTQAPSDRPVPAAASASSSPEASDLEQSSPSDLLAGVDLATEEVEPGVYRVVSDGVRDLTNRLVDVTVSPSGDVWVERGKARDWSIVRLGEPGVSRKLGRKEPWTLALSLDGEPIALSREHGTRVFDGVSWTAGKLSEYHRCVLQQRQSQGFVGGMGPDASCWLPGWASAGGALARVEPDGTRSTYPHAAVGLGPDQVVLSTTVGPDGTLVAPFAEPYGGCGSFKGLLAYDGAMWSRIGTYDGETVGTCHLGVAVDPQGGVLVAGGHLDGEHVILSWDGDSWTSHQAGLTERDAFPVQRWPNGDIWFGSRARWDGTSLTEVDPSVPWGEGTRLALAPDGSAWTVVEGQLYVITPDALVGTE